MAIGKYSRKQMKFIASKDNKTMLERAEAYNIGYSAAMHDLRAESRKRRKRLNA